MESVLACVLTAAITLPASYFVASACLRGVILIITGEHRRDVL